MAVSVCTQDALIFSNYAKWFFNGIRQLSWLILTVPAEKGKSSLFSDFFMVFWVLVGFEIYRRGNHSHCILVNIEKNGSS